MRLWYHHYSLESVYHKYLLVFFYFYFFISWKTVEVERLEAVCSVNPCLQC